MCSVLQQHKKRKNKRINKRSKVQEIYDDR